MKVVLPMAGSGSRLAGQGLSTPKPLIETAGQPMVFWALESLDRLPISRYIFVVLREHDRVWQLGSLLSARIPNAEIVAIDKVTEGQLCTVLAARDLIDTDEDLLIASCDTYVVSNLADDIARRDPACRGILSVADMPGDRWSFARTDESGRVVEVTEKVRISNHASTGLYYFSNGREFVEVADGMISRGERTRGEYYVMPVYQKYIERGWRVEISPAIEMWDMGTPASLEAFEARAKTLGVTVS
jgi:dTDP-glucose pyrophosphorylase